MIVNEPKEADGELRSGNMFDRECVEDFHKKKLQRVMINSC